MDSNNEPAKMGHNNGPSFGTTEKVEDLVEATLDAVLKRVRSDDCNGTDIGAAVKVLKEVGALHAIATTRELLDGQIRQQQMVDELPDVDEYNYAAELPVNRPSR